MPTTQNHGEHIHILIVEDDEEYAFSLRSRLERDRTLKSRYALTVSWAADEVEAVRQIRALSPHIVILDLSLRRRPIDHRPSQVVMEFIHELCPECGIFAVTGIDWPPIKVAPFERRTLRFFHKSVDRKHIVDEILRFLEKRGDGPGPVFTKQEVDSLLQWAGSDEAMIAIAFTDVVNWTGTNERIGDVGMDQLREAHHLRVHRLVADSRGKGFVVKSTGDGYLVAFRVATRALDFALDLLQDSGHAQIQVRAGIAAGVVRIRHDDLYGMDVIYARRVMEQSIGPGVWVSRKVKEDIEKEKAPQHLSLRFREWPDRELKGFQGKHSVFEVLPPAY